MGAKQKPQLQTLCGLAPQCAGLPQLVERLAFGRNRGNRDSSLEHDGPADPKMGAGAAVLVENGPKTHIVAFRISGRGRLNVSGVYRCLPLSTAVYRPDHRHR